MSRRVLTLLLAAILVAGLAVAGAYMPVPYVALMPGPLANTLGNDPGTKKPLITVEGHATYPTTGRLDLTTVSVAGGPGQQLSLFDALEGWVDRRRAIVPQQLIFPPGQSTQQVERENALEMQQSQDHAITAALRYLGIPVHLVVTVDQVLPHTPASGVLKEGDVIVAVDGHPVATETQLRDLIGKHKAGESVQLTIRRGGRPMQVRVGTVAESKTSSRPIIGIEPRTRPRFPFTVDMQLENVGGPSAGMMFALGLVDKLTPGALTGGRFIAGTGTIDDTGTVGPIGGIQQKVIAAADAGATVFLAPADECADARKVAPKRLRILRVHTLKGAVSALEAIEQRKPVPSC